MKIQLANLWHSLACPDMSKATLDIENVGQQSIAMPLPPDLLKQIENFYISEYRKRLDLILGKI